MAPSRVGATTMGARAETRRGTGWEPARPPTKAVHARPYVTIRSTPASKMDATALEATDGAQRGDIMAVGAKQTDDAM